ncbi:MAG: nitroreductase family protein [Anaerolineae bacterium]|nr:nitroreductase family protein [Anaerolineae bacterium]
MIPANPHIDDSLLHVLKDRRSIRRYSSAPVDKAIVLRLLDAAIWAPSAHNRQPWRFVVIQADEVKAQLAESMSEKLRGDLLADSVPADIADADAARSRNRIISAPLAILLCLSMLDMDRYADAHRNQKEYIMAVQSVAMAGQNLLLAAHTLGLGACWMCAPLFCPEVVHTVLHLPEDWQPQGLLTIGYPAETRVKTRNPIESSVIWR